MKSQRNPATLSLIERLTIRLRQSGLYKDVRFADEIATALYERDERIAELEATPSPSPAPGIVTILNAAYAAGFEASGEGWNAEYPFADGNGNFEDDPDWTSLRDKRIAPLLASLSQPAKGEREGSE